MQFTVNKMLANMLNTNTTLCDPLHGLERISVKGKDNL